MISQKIHFQIIADRLGIHHKSVYNWLKRFIIRRFSWLLGKHYKNRGQKAKLTNEQKKELHEIVDKGPEASGFDSGVWTTAMIVEVVNGKFGVRYTPKYMAKLLKTIGLTYQKAKFESDKLDEKEHKRKRRDWDTKKWPEILTQADTLGAVILFGDEVSFAQWGSLSRTWAPRGKQPVVKTRGKRKGMKVFGAIEFNNGDFHYEECDGKFNGDSYARFLGYVLSKYDCPVILIEDGASYHGGPAVDKFKEENKGKLIVYRLPSYSPDKNPIERLWKKTKKDATHCKYFADFEDLRKSVLKAFNKYLSDATHVISTMKKLRTQAGVL